MTEKQNSLRTEDRSHGDMIAALLAAQDVAYSLQEKVLADFENPSSRIKSEFREAQKVGDQVKEMLADIPEEARIHMSASVIEALKSVRTFADLGGAQQAFKTALHAALEAASTEHKEHMTAEQKREARLKELKHTIDEANEAIGDDLDKLYRSGKISRDQWLELKNEKARIAAMPEGPEKTAAERAYGERQAEILDPVRAEATRTQDAVTVETVDNITHNQDKVETASEEYNRVYAQQREERVDIAQDRAATGFTRPTRNEEENQHIGEEALGTLAPEINPARSLQIGHGAAIG